MSRVVAVNPSLVVERVGSDYLMLTASGAEVVRATGDAADVITCAINGQPLPDRLHTAADVLQRHGVLTTTTSVTNTFTPSRRHALQLGAAAAAVGLTMLALPNAAAAASVVPPAYTFTGVSAAYCTSFDSGGVDYFIYEIELKESGTFTLTSGDLDAEIILVGGGGSGSNPPSVGLIGGGGGGGGGGGELDVLSAISVVSGTAYPIIVGAGGAAVTDPPGAGNTSTGNDGGTTTAFGITVQAGKGGDGRSGGASGQPFSGGGDGGSSNGGGGGGAGGVGGDGVADSGGSSGAGFSHDGVTALLAEGGGGGGSPGAGSGSAGGGTGGRPATPGIPELLATEGETNTGSGGGGGYAGNGSGAGGSGIVIVRFYDACGPMPT